MPENQLDLKFFPGSSCGFTPSGIAGFSDLRPDAVVRELIQNSLDAAISIGQPCARVQFRLGHCDANDIPGIDTYRVAFQEAVADQKKLGGGKLPSQAERVVDSIKDALDQDMHDILTVLDNGVGLNKSRMNALLSDGISVKEGSATGTFGNGHSVVIPASDLRYVLYGGITDASERICGGHAVIASRRKESENCPLSGDGFLVHGMTSGTYQFGMGAGIPSLIADELDRIKRHWEHGTAIIIPAFNNFRAEDSSDPWPEIRRAAACGFVHAIYEGKLIVEFKDCRPGRKGRTEKLNRSSLRSVLREQMDTRWGRGFLSGFWAAKTLEALQSGTEHEVSTNLGRIKVRLHSLDEGTSRVDLWRNGMWITDSIVQFRNKFNDRQPFHALLLVDANLGGELYELVRNAEGPLHNQLNARQRLRSEEKNKLYAAFREIRDWLLDQAEKISTDSYSPDDFLAVDFGHADGKGLGRPSFRGMPVVINKRAPNRSYENAEVGQGRASPSGKKRNSRRNRRPQPLLGPIFHAISVPIGVYRQMIQLECQEGVPDAELRLCVDDNVDATCDIGRRLGAEAVFLDAIRINGQQIQSDQLISQNGRAIGVRLGNLSAGEALRIRAAYSLPDDLVLPPNTRATLRVDIMRGISPSRQKQ